MANDDIKIHHEFTRFFTIFYIPLCRFVERYVERADSSDIAQDVFLKVYEKWMEFESLEHTRMFLFSVARNTCLDFIKHRKARDNYLRKWKQENESEKVFLHNKSLEELSKILYGIVEKLPKQTKQVILLSFEKKSIQEIATQMNISVNTVKTLKQKGYIILKKSLSEYI